MPDIRIDRLWFTYAGAPAPVLRAIDLHIPAGSFVLLAGPSGCGKSTLALVLAGLIPSRIAGRLEGSVYLGERNLSTMEISEVAQQVGMVFQNPDNQLIHLDVESEVAFGPENLALPREVLRQRVDTALDYTRMADQRLAEIFALSGGQKQRVAISATLAMLPAVLVLDEPTSDLDPVGTQEVLEVLRMLNKEFGITIILVEHKVDEVIAAVDRVVLMDAGCVVLDSPPRTAFTNPGQWEALGVAVPQLVTLAQALPDVFGGATPLTVGAVYDALRDTPYAHALRQHSAAFQRQSVSDRPDEAPLVAWERVGLRYGDKQVLHAIDLQVRAQEWLAVIGPNGSGKTSLASLAMGFQAPTSGTVRHRGRVVEAGNISRQARHMAYLFQAADTMLFSATVEQELLFGLPRGRALPEATRAAAEALLATIDLGAQRGDNPFHLSHGQRKRLAIGALLMRSPEVLILDEPTTGQDEGHARAFLKFLQHLRQHQRLTYMMITHDMRAVAQYASRVVVLFEGRVALDDRPARVFAQADELARYSILPPPIAQLHALLCAGRAPEVALNVPDFVQLVRPVEVAL